MKILLIAVLLAAMPVARADAQSHKGVPPTDELYKTIASLDAAIFGAYNDCDMEKFASYLTEDVEFYHDKSAPTGTRQEVVDAVKRNICGKVRRELVPGTLEVYPMEGYGALEIGIHRFYELKGPHPDKASGEAQFVQLWQNKGGVWKITRIISFDHGPAPR